MQFSAREDIEAPIHAVFDMVADFDRFERMAIRRGLEIRRIGTPDQVMAGTSWETVVTIRGKPRHINVVLTNCEAPSLMRFEALSKGMSGETVIELMALSQRRTRLSINTSVAAKTLPARLLLQSLKLGRSRIKRQFQVRFSEFARNLEERNAHRT